MDWLLKDQREVGGIFNSLVIGLIFDAIAEFGFDYVFSAVVKELYKRGESKETILSKVDKYPVSKL